MHRDTLNNAQVGSPFTPAIAAWSLGGLDLGPKLPYLLIAAALGLAYTKKIPMWAGAAGAGAVWFFMLRGAGTVVTNGIGIVSGGTTLQLTANSPGVITNDAAQFPTMTVGGSAYSILRTETNTDGSVSYYLEPA